MELTRILAVKSVYDAFLSGDLSELPSTFSCNFEYFTPEARSAIVGWQNFMHREIELAAECGARLEDIEFAEGPETVISIVRHRIDRTTPELGAYTFKSGDHKMIMNCTIWRFNKEDLIVRVESFPMSARLPRTADL
ncbi:hypothetical protein [Streptomyces sp. NPDC053431]|uniref:hypothetical protein n=1 Tax=Streptomyces sp. NPDC053431 TaxID=3365703 RepID=UPI0037CCF9B0